MFHNKKSTTDGAAMNDRRDPHQEALRKDFVMVVTALLIFSLDYSLKWFGSGLVLLSTYIHIRGYREIALKTGIYGLDLTCPFPCP